MTVLEARGLVKSYGGVTVLSAERVALEPGEIVALLGPNGAGKSTLLHLLALLEYPDRGEIFFRGKKLEGHGAWFAARRQITLVEQKPYAFPRSVQGNAVYGLRLRGVPRAEAEERAGGMLGRLGLAELSRRPARGLSGGELARLALARALLCEPAVLLLDEPTAHMDRERGREAEEAIRAAAGAGAAVVIATHAGEQAERLAGRVIRVEEGLVK